MSDNPSSRNAERISGEGGVKAISSDPPIPNQDSLLKWTNPTEFVTLPSQGRFYISEHPLFMKKDVEIRYMSTPQEDILANQSYLKKGVAIEKLIESILVDRKIRPEFLTSGDRNAIIVATRITGYGEEYKVSIPCSACADVKEHTFDLKNVTQNEGILSEEKKEQYKAFLNEETKTFSFLLPKTNVSVECRLLTGQDETYLSETSALRKQKKLQETPLLDQMKQYVVSLNGVMKKDLIDQFLKVMPASDSKYLRNTYAELVPNIEFKQLVTCDECGANQEVNVPFGASFFWFK